MIFRIILVLFLTTQCVPAYAQKEMPASNEPVSEHTFDLKGKDFGLFVWEEGDDDARYKSMLITMGDGRQVTEYWLLDGSKQQLDETAFSTSDSFELKNLIPGAPREQLVVTCLPWPIKELDGVCTYSIYRIDETRVTELLDLVIRREVNGTNKRPPLSLTATVQEETKNGELLIVYRYTTDNHNYRTIIFRWNGSAFVDITGAYKEIHKKYSP